MLGAGPELCRQVVRHFPHLGRRNRDMHPGMCAKVLVCATQFVEQLERPLARNDLVVPLHEESKRDADLAGISVIAKPRHEVEAIPLPITVIASEERNEAIPSFFVGDCFGRGKRSEACCSLAMTSIILAPDSKALNE